MTAFEEHREELEHYETMMGPERGRLAVTLDLLTNALVSWGSMASIATATVARRGP